MDNKDLAMSEPSGRRNLLIVMVIIGALLSISIGLVDAYLRSYNEVSEEDRAIGIRTKVGTYTSSQPIGTLPLAIILSIKQWRDRALCLVDPSKQVLRWADFDSLEDLQVCLNRLFNGVSSDEDVAKILVANGFSAFFLPKLRRGPRKSLM